MKKQEFGAGIWHFATYLDRYATDGYGEPRSVIEAIELCLLYTSPGPRDVLRSRMPSSA